jgi:hypothetical protein
VLAPWSLARGGLSWCVRRRGHPRAGQGSIPWGVVDPGATPESAICGRSRKKAASPPRWNGCLASRTCAGRDGWRPFSPAITPEESPRRMEDMRPIGLPAYPGKSRPGWTDRDLVSMDHRPGVEGRVPPRPPVIQQPLSAPPRLFPSARPTTRSVHVQTSAKAP